MYMRYIKGRKPNGSMIVAIIALVVATTGGAYAASKINGKNLVRDSVASSKIKNETLKSKDFSNQAKRDLRGEARPAWAAGRRQGRRATSGRRVRPVRPWSLRRPQLRAQSSPGPPWSTFPRCR